MNLLELVSEDGGTFRRVASTNGGEFAGGCPWCGGSDRFRLWPESGRYWCRGCGKSGDSIQYLRDKRGISFAEACELVGLELAPRSAHPRPAPTVWEPREPSEPGEAWQERAKTFLAMANETLWGPRGTAAREWLRELKGLSAATIREAGLGYCLRDSFEPRAAWGLPAALKDTGRERRRQWLPAGLVVPHVVGGAVLRLRVRREAPGDGPRYVLLSGSSAAPLVLNAERAAALVVESELDALLLNQEAGDLAATVSLGSAQTRPDARAHELLKRVAVVLLALDADDPGAAAAWRFWPEVYGAKVKRWPCLNGKDPSDALAHGLDLRAWVVAGLFGDEAALERFAIMTTDGRLSDSEAMAALQCAS